MEREENENLVQVKFEGGNTGKRVHFVTTSAIKRLKLTKIGQHSLVPQLHIRPPQLNITHNVGDSRQNTKDQIDQEKSPGTFKSLQNFSQPSNPGIRHSLVPQLHKRSQQIDITNNEDSIQNSKDLEQEKIKDSFKSMQNFGPPTNPGIRHSLAPQNNKRPPQIDIINNGDPIQNSKDHIEQAKILGNFKSTKNFSQPTNPEIKHSLVPQLHKRPLRIDITDNGDSRQNSKEQIEEEKISVTFKSMQNFSQPTNPGIRYSLVPQHHKRPPQIDITNNGDSIQNSKDHIEQGKIPGNFRSTKNFSQPTNPEIRHYLVPQLHKRPQQIDSTDNGDFRQNSKEQIEEEKIPVTFKSLQKFSQPTNPGIRHALVPQHHKHPPQIDFTDNEDSRHNLDQIEQEKIPASSKLMQNFSHTTSSGIKQAEEKHKTESNVYSESSLQDTIMCRPNFKSTPELSYVAKQLASIKIDVKHILKHIKPTEEFIINLPLKNMDEIQELDIKIKENYDYASNITKYFIRYVPIPGKHNSTGLSQIITDDCIAQYNWDGLNGKLALRSTTLCSKILFDSWKGELQTVGAYQASMKKQIFDAHNRNNRRKTRSK